MTDAKYITFLRRLFDRCHRKGGKTDIRDLVANDLPYDACYSFMQWGEQDGICTPSLMQDNIIIWLDPQFLNMSRPDFYKHLKQQFKYWKKYDPSSNF